jgi:hypothetical protein
VPVKDEETALLKFAAQGIETSRGSRCQVLPAP